ncbi:MAG TPA: MucR family transcriptional regulator [Alphaproteobacteria bacterium]|nr:MucR family transcriptional regulator [Alphaproteobacteria bacterium]
MIEENADPAERDGMLRMTADLVSAYLSNNALPPGQIPDVIRTVYDTLGGVGRAVEGRHAALKPAVPIKRSVRPDYIVCLEDGKKLKMLKRHLRTTYGLTPAEYRAKWGLPADYPMVAPHYAAQRSAFAKKIGLGRNAPGQGRQRAR